MFSSKKEVYIEKLVCIFLLNAKKLNVKNIDYGKVENNAGEARRNFLSL